MQPAPWAARRSVLFNISVPCCCPLADRGVVALQMWFWVSPNVLCGRVFEVYADRMGIDLGSIQVPCQTRG